MSVLSTAGHLLLNFTLNTRQVIVLEIHRLLLSCLNLNKPLILTGKLSTFLAKSFRFQGEILNTSKHGRRIVSKGILVIQNISKFDAGKKSAEIKFLDYQHFNASKFSCIFNGSTVPSTHQF